MTAAGSSRATAALFSALAGYLSLSQEIVWLRLAGVGFRDEPVVFAYVIGWMLLGLAAGAWVGPWVLRALQRGPLALVALAFATSGLVGYAALFGVGRLYGVSLELGQAASLPLVALVALANGLVFPALCEAAAGQGAPGELVGRLYFANIVGSTLGPLVTGFVLFDRFSTEAVALGLCVGWLAGAALALVASGARARWALPALLALGVAAVALQPAAFGRLLERLEHAERFDTDGHRYVWTRETRSGVIAVTRGAQADVISGGGVYDGHFNTNLEQDTNGLFRAYAVSALHPAPRRVLVIGVASGSWMAVLAKDARVERMTGIEINPGYFDLMRHYEDAARLLEDPRVELVVDDGRRWLERHPEATFDLVEMNTTLHWRAGATNLLSREFLELVRRHLAPGGVLYFNTTMSSDVIHTGVQLFASSVLVYNTLAVSDAPFDLRREVATERLMHLMDGDRPWFAGEGRGPLLEKVLGQLNPKPDFPGRLVTDDNMMPEVGDRRLAPTWLSLAHAAWRRATAPPPR